MKFLPSSVPGKWAAGLGISALLVFLFLLLLAGKLVHLPDLVMVFFVAFSILASFAALILGSIAVIKHRDRSLLVFISILIGLVSLLRLLAIFFRGRIL